MKTPNPDFAGKIQLAYIVIFLRNSGERIRAIWLAKQALNLSLKEAKDWVESVNLINGPSVKYLNHVSGECEQTLPAQTVSHWPANVTTALKTP